MMEPVLREPYARFCATLRRYLEKQECALIEAAFEAAASAHREQRRKSGAPYITHPLAVAQTLAEWRMSAPLIAAALLHDVLEDTAMTEAAMREQFGGEITELVKGVTKLGKQFKALRRKGALPSQDDLHAVNMTRLMLTMTRNPRVMVIKLADRQHNIRTLRWHRPEKQKSIAQETMDFFVPIAARLGIWCVKRELEERCLRVLAPEEYAAIERSLAESRAALEKTVAYMRKQIARKMEAMGLEAEIEYLPQRVVNLYRRQREGRWNLSRPVDEIRFRLLLPRQEACYTALGAVHALWRPIPGRITDYIAAPKDFFYSALHTTLIGPQGHLAEIRLTTPEMHHLAEYGIVALLQRGEPLHQALPWLEELSALPHDDPKTFIKLVKKELKPERIHVFTPRGDVVELPVGATPVDFAYAIHTELGHRCRQALVNGLYVPLNHPLRHGDQVEIVRGTEAKPSRLWLDEDLGYVASPSTLRRIRRWFTHRPVDRLIEEGRALVVEEIRLWGEIHGWGEEHLHRVARFAGLEVADLCLRVGRGDLSAAQLGELVLRYTLEKGPGEEERFLTLRVEATDRPNLLRDTTQVIGEANVNLLSAWARASEETGLALVHLTMERPPLRQTVRIAHRLRHLPNVITVRRGLPQSRSIALPRPEPGSTPRPRTTYPLVLFDYLRRKLMPETTSA